MAWVTLSDATGSYEVTLFSEVLNRSRDLLTEGTAVLVTAEARLDGEMLRLTAQDDGGAGEGRPGRRPGHPALAGRRRRGESDPRPC